MRAGHEIAGGPVLANAFEIMAFLNTMHSHSPRSRTALCGLAAASTSGICPGCLIYCPTARRPESPDICSCTRPTRTAGDVMAPVSLQRARQVGEVLEWPVTWQHSLSHRVNTWHCPPYASALERLWWLPARTATDSVGASCGGHLATFA